MATNTFPNSMSRYKDTRDAGGITIQNVELNTDEEGFVQAPAVFEKDLAPHGFYREGSPAYNDWLKTQPKKRPVAQQPAK